MYYKALKLKKEVRFAKVLTGKVPVDDVPPRFFFFLNCMNRRDQMLTFVFSERLLEKTGEREQKGLPLM